MSKLKSIVNLLIVLLSITQLSYGASLHLEWDANNEEDLAGYKVYYGTSSGNYGEPDDAENVTEYELSGLTEGETYYVAITAYDTSDNESQNLTKKVGWHNHLLIPRIPLSPSPLQPHPPLTQLQTALLTSAELPQTMWVSQK